MKKGLIIIIAVIAVIAIIAIAVAGSYNGFVDKQETVNKAKSDVGVQLQRRADLIPNFVATVKGYSDYEQKTLTAVTEARAAVGQAKDKSVSDIEAANTELDKAISVWVNAVTEAYPDLKANAQYIALQDELSGTENRIATARRDYNNAAKEYNVKVRRFPGNIIAGMFGFDKADLFTENENAQSAPTVTFD